MSGVSDTEQRYQDLVSGIQDLPWYVPGYPGEAPTLMNVDKLQCNALSTQYCLLFESADGIMVPGKLKYHQNYAMGIFGMTIDQYVTLDSAKKDGETDLECVDRIVNKIVLDYDLHHGEFAAHMEQAKADVLLARKRMHRYLEQAMRKIADREPADFDILCAEEMQDRVNSLAPSAIMSLTMGVADTIRKVQSLVNALAAPETRGTVDGNRLTVEVDTDRIWKFREEVGDISQGTNVLVDIVDGKITLELSDATEGSPLVFPAEDGGKSRYIE